MAPSLVAHHKAGKSVVIHIFAEVDEAAGKFDLRRQRMTEMCSKQLLCTTFRSACSRHLHYKKNEVRYSYRSLPPLILRAGTPMFTMSLCEHKHAHSTAVPAAQCAYFCFECGKDICQHCVAEHRPKQHSIIQVGVAPGGTSTSLSP